MSALSLQALGTMSVKASPCKGRTQGGELCVLRGSWDLISRPITSISHIVTPIIPIIDLITY